MVRNVGRGAAAVAVAALLAGCASGASEPSAGAGAGSAGPSAKAGVSPSAEAGAKAGASASPGVTAAAKGGTVGAAGSACPLPVTFDVAAGWKPKKVEPLDDPDLAELNDLLEQGTVTMACEIDAKPAGNIGFLRVWTDDAKGAAPRTVLESFVAADDSPSSVVYRDVRVGRGGALAATEVTYTVMSELLDEPKKARALAVATPRGPLVLELGGMDSEEHDAMLPAYELAKGSLAATGG
ncbi:lipoprotein [Streptomyces sp. TRM76323]|uniref:Lipoprotein n=1 Tax=Streptomyces tamarix TaxID=3078565 RepID=A0ABU3QTU9_9ACTN|nr:lipoprotein [Streptomyces tamarix]MDT9685792.1 lipoprotein [Streptomyces tamarix]